MNVLLIILVGGLIGFLASRWLWGKSEGKRGRVPNLRFKLRKKTVAMHHWPIALILAVGWVMKFGFDGIFGVLVGSALQGLTYRGKFKFWS